MDKGQNPYWYKLIKLLKQKGIITTGLTIPYIYGAYKILDKPFSDLADLVNEVLNSKIDKYPVVQKCPVIRQHVICVEPKDTYNRKYIKDVKLSNTTGDGILFISTNTDLGKSSEKLSSNLTTLYWKYIEKKKYSWNNTKEDWMRFDDKEVELILSVK